MRIVLPLLFALSLAACGKKKSPEAPAPDTEQQTEQPMDQESEEQDVNTPAEGEEPADMRTADPQEGGE